MKRIELTMPQLALIAGTRGLLGAGIGLLASQLIPRRHRKIVAWSLVAAGALSTIPLAIKVVKKIKAAPSDDSATPGVQPSSLQTWPEAKPAETIEPERQPVSAEL
ncbi:MAG TPA: hypothetical protein VHM90_05940 [Phycisphaerae bacterium]|jgi:hypothetical protein|nr:hypothetical protein [Phycisphaerae bacterium]